MARTYKRDANGRFAGGGGGGGRKGAKLPAPKARKVGSKPQQRRGLITQRAAVKSTKAKLAAKDPADRSINGQLSRRSQKGAVTKASNALAAAKQSGRVRLSGRSGVIRPGAKKAAPMATPAAAKAKARPASGRKISDAKAKRIVARIDANRPNLRPASGSHRRSLNAIRTHDRASDFVLAATKRSIKRGKESLGVVESTKRAVANATKRRRRKAAPVAVSPASSVVPRGTGRRTRMASASGRIANRTGQSKTLNKYNSRPEPTRGAYVGGRYVPKEKLKGRQPLDLSYGSDRAYASAITKTAARRQAGAVKQQQRQTTEQRRSVAEAKQKALIAPLVGTRKRGTKKQQRSIQTLERAKSFYGRGNNVDTLFVDVKRPGFRLPRSKRM